MTFALQTDSIRKNEYRKSWESSAPAYSISSRSSLGDVELGRTSRDSRPEITSKDVVGAVNRTLKRPPAFSIVSRSYIDGTREFTKSPGPQRYSVPNIISNLSHPLYPMPPTKIFAGSQRKMHDANMNPSPGEYEVALDSFLKKAPTYSIRSKPLESVRSGLVPDSGSYDVTEITRNGKVWRGPSWSVTGRPGNKSSTLKDDTALIGLEFAEPPSILGRKRFDTSGSRRSSPVPNWSFSKSHRNL